jgi:hypothetical protein
MAVSPDRARLEAEQERRWVAVAKVDYASRGFEREREDGRHDGRHGERSGKDRRDDSSRDPHDN